MDKLKFALLSIVVLSLVGLTWYWSVSTIESGSDHAINQKVKELSEENEKLKTEVRELTFELAALKPKVVESTPQIVTPTPEVKKPAPAPTTYEHQTLINDLQKLVDDGVTMKLKSMGSRVGTVQKFLNIYNDTSLKVDNDYGAGTVKLVTEFQKAEGLLADGEAGPGTFRKMIEWLKEQG